MSKGEYIRPSKRTVHELATEDEGGIEVTPNGVIAKSEVKRLTPHGLRHTFASLLLADGVPVPEVLKLLGHKDSYVTWKIYAHFTGEDTRAVQNLAASILHQSR